MRLKQLSVFLENRPHQIRLPARTLAEAGVDILTLNLADTEQFGILRLIAHGIGQQQFMAHAQLRKQLAPARALRREIDEVRHSYRK